MRNLRMSDMEISRKERIIVTFIHCSNIIDMI